MFAEDSRREMLVTEYNSRFRSLVAPPPRRPAPPTAGTVGEDHPHPTSAMRSPESSEPTTLIDHVVGAGKSGVMVVAAYQMRRLGLVRQPWIVVPNHICEQFGREALSWVPGAKIPVGAEQH